MTVLRQFTRLSSSLTFVLLSLAQSAVALPHSPSERAKLFATCSGYLGALAVLQRNIDPKEARKTEEMRNTFDALLDAVLPDATAHGMPREVAWNWRFNAWIDQSEILNDVSYSVDTGRATRAQSVADHRYAICREVILPS